VRISFLIIFSTTNICIINYKLLCKIFNRIKIKLFEYQKNRNYILFKMKTKENIERKKKSEDEIIINNIKKDIILYFGNVFLNQNHKKIECKGNLLEVRKILKKSNIIINKEKNEKNKTVECEIFLVKNSAKLRAKVDEVSFSIFDNNQSIDNFYKSDENEMDESDENEIKEKKKEQLKIEETNEKEKNKIKQTIENLIGKQNCQSSYYFWRICNINEEFDNFENLIIYEKNEEILKVSLFKNCSKEIREIGNFFLKKKFINF
jgi:hypothetical protein